MFFQTKNSANKQYAGFTLIEILVVITLLAAIAGAVVVAYENVQSQGNADAIKFEMAELRKALLQFRRDSGSNDFPGQGVYDCDDLSITIAQANDPAGIDTWPTGAPSADTDPAEWSDWCKHPANFWMLFINPLDDLTTSPDVEGEWNPDTHRGWNGPYIQGKSGYLDIDADYKTDGTYALPSLSSLITNVWGIASPYLSKPLNNGDLTWRSIIGPNSYSKHGTPYFMFDLDDDDENNSDSEARIVSLATDNVYDEQDNPNCEQGINSEGYPIDNILCLLR